MNRLTPRLAQRLTATTAAAVLALLALAAPAEADEVVINDGADATASVTDLRKVRVDHGADEITVRVNFPDLRKQADAGLNIFIDKLASRRGPEFALFTPLFSGSDYALLRMKRWQPVGGPVDCDYDVALRWKRDVVVFTADRGCFGDPDELRIGMRMRDTADQSHPVTDWLIGRRDFTAWLGSA